MAAIFADMYEGTGPSEPVVFKELDNSTNLLSSSSEALDTTRQFIWYGYAVNFPFLLAVTTIEVGSGRASKM